MSNLWFFREYARETALVRSVFFSPKCSKYRSAAGLRPDPLGELTALPQNPSWIKGRLYIYRHARERRGGDSRERKKRGEKGMVKVKVKSIANSQTPLAHSDIDHTMLSANDTISAFTVGIAQQAPPRSYA